LEQSVNEKLVIPQMNTMPVNMMMPTQSPYSGFYPQIVQNSRGQFVMVPRMMPMSNSAPESSPAAYGSMPSYFQMQGGMMPYYSSEPTAQSLPMMSLGTFVSGGYGSSQSQPSRTLFYTESGFPSSSAPAPMSPLNSSPMQSSASGVPASTGSSPSSEPTSAPMYYNHPSYVLSPSMSERHVPPTYQVSTRIVNSESKIQEDKRN
jgi:hypothetical protein